MSSETYLRIQRRMAANAEYLARDHERRMAAIKRQNEERAVRRLQVGFWVLAFSICVWAICQGKV